MKSFLFFAVIISCSIGFSSLVTSESEGVNKCGMLFSYSRFISDSRVGTGAPILNKLSDHFKKFNNSQLNNERFINDFVVFSKRNKIQLSTNGFFNFRMKNDVELRSIYQDLGILKGNKIQFPTTDIGTKKFLSALKNKIQIAVNYYGSENVLVPKALVAYNENQIEKDGKAYAWDYDPSSINKVSLSNDLNFAQMTFGDWSKLLFEHKLFFTSINGEMFYHDFSHIIDMLKNPYEAMVLQRKFYEFIEKTNKKYNSEQKIKFYDKMFKIGTLLFEGFSFPNIKKIKMYFESDINDSVFNKFKSENGLLLAEKLINDQNKSNEIEDKLKNFEKTFLANDVAFYDSIKGYGGDYYDVVNHFRSGVNPFATSEQHGDIEILYMRYKNGLSQNNNNLIRLYVAYYNAVTLKFSFVNVYNDVTSKSKTKDKYGVLNPLKNTLTEHYFRSYAGEKFVEGLLSN